MERVLVVDDSPTQLQRIRMLLEDEGYVVDVAADGNEAMARIRQAPPDVVATDLEMPGMNGLQLVEAIRHEYPQVPVILMTAHGSEEIAALALRKGAASYVPKAYLEHDIVPTLQRILSLAPAMRPGVLSVAGLTQVESRFVLANDPALIAAVVAYQDDLLLRLNFCDATERIRVGVALQEALLNAMYHGNVELSSELRQEDEKVYHEQFRLRRAQPPYDARRVHFEARVTPEEAVFVVRDEGPGFDPSKLPDPTDPANLGRVGGRGLLIMRAFLDEVTHNAAGNAVTLVKRRAPGRCVRQILLAPSGITG